VTIVDASICSPLGPHAAAPPDPNHMSALLTRLRAKADRQSVGGHRPQLPSKQVPRRITVSVALPTAPEGRPTMSTEQQYPDPGTEHQTATRQASDALAERAEERADIEEDRRRQQELANAEMGGES
jgi:hypothetical protein